MKRRFIIAAVLILTAASAFAADDDTSGVPFRKSFSLELGTGLQPLHMTLSPTMKEEDALTEIGQEIKGEATINPTISLSEVWRFDPHWEFCLTEGICWKYMEVWQYDTFGIDPKGKPRYDLNKHTSLGMKPFKPIGTLSAQIRFIWVPEWKVAVYSAVGAGFSTATEFIPLPQVTPIALRVGGEHFYFFEETTLGPIASFVHLGLGWKF